MHGTDASIVAARAKVGEEPGESWLELNDTILLHPPPWCVERSLRIVAVVDDAADDLKMPLRLHRPAHHAERPEQSAVLEQHPGDDRVKRALGGAERVRVASERG